jgi:hypothetical protein
MDVTDTLGGVLSVTTPSLRELSAPAQFPRTGVTV